MAAPKSMATAGLQVFYGELNTTPATLLSGLAKVPKLPIPESRSYESTTIDQLNEDGSVDETEYMEPGERRAQGTMDLVFRDDGTLGTFATLLGLVEQKMAWMVKFKNGSTLTFNGWVSKGPGFDPQEKGDVLINVTITLYGEPAWEGS